MADLKKAIKAVEYGIRAAEIAGGGEKLGRSSIVMMHTTDLDNILELLKAQEPRVMTLEEVKSAKACWIESEDRVFPAIYYCQGNGKRFSVFIVNGDDDVFEDYEEEPNDNEIWMENNYMNQFWRCWTSRPTDEQRKAAK